MKLRSNNEWDLSQPVRWCPNEQKMVEVALTQELKGVDGQRLIEALLVVLIEERKKAPAEERPPSSSTCSSCGIRRPGRSTGTRSTGTCTTRM